MKVDLKMKTGKICKPLKCPFCQQDCVRKQTLNQHLRNNHQNYQLDDETVNRIVTIVDDEKLVPGFLPPNILSLIEAGLDLQPTITTTTTTPSSSTEQQSQPIGRSGTTIISPVETPTVTNNQEPSFSSGYQQPVDNYNRSDVFSEIPDERYLLKLLANPFTTSDSD